MVSGIWIVDIREIDDDTREIVDDARCGRNSKRMSSSRSFDRFFFARPHSHPPRLLHPTDGDAPSPLMEHDPVALQQRKAYSGTSEHQVSIVVDDPFDGDGVSAAMQRSLLEDEKPLQLVRHRHRHRSSSLAPHTLTSRSRCSRLYSGRGCTLCFVSYRLDTTACC